jgi:hypothetical protein
MDQIKPPHANEKPLPRGVCLASIFIIVGDLSRAQDELDLDSIPIFQDASRGVSTINRTIIIGGSEI